MGHIIILPEYAPPPPDWFGLVTYSTSDPQNFYIHYLDMTDTASFGNFLATEAATYPMSDAGSAFPYDASYDWASDRLLMSQGLNFTSWPAIDVNTYNRSTGANTFTSGGWTGGAFKSYPWAATLNPSATTFYWGEQSGAGGSGRVIRAATPYPTWKDTPGFDVEADGVATPVTIGTSHVSIDIDKNDDNMIWTFEGGQIARKFNLTTGVEVTSFNAGVGFSGAAGLAHTWDNKILSMYDATRGVGMHNDTGGAPLRSRNITSLLPAGQDVAGIFAWNPLAAKPF